MNQVDWTKAPPSGAVEGLRRYVEQGIRPGHFLQGLLSNDLRMTIAAADSENMRLLHNWVLFVHWELPGRIHGHKSVMDAWIRLHERAQT